MCRILRVDARIWILNITNVRYNESEKKNRTITNLRTVSYTHACTHSQSHSLFQSYGCDARTHKHTRTCTHAQCSACCTENTATVSCYSVVFFSCHTTTAIRYMCTCVRHREWFQMNDDIHAVSGFVCEWHGYHGIRWYESTRVCVRARVCVCVVDIVWMGKKHGKRESTDRDRRKNKTPGRRCHAAAVRKTLLRNVKIHRHTYTLTQARTHSALTFLPLYNFDISIVAVWFACFSLIHFLCKGKNVSIVCRNAEVACVCIWTSVCVYMCLRACVCVCG